MTETPRSSSSRAEDDVKGLGATCKTPVDPAAIETLRRLLAEKQALLAELTMLADEDVRNGAPPLEEWDATEPHSLAKDIKEARAEVVVLERVPALLDERHSLIDRIAALEQEKAESDREIEWPTVAHPTRRIKAKLLPARPRDPIAYEPDDVEKAYIDRVHELESQLTAAEQGATALREALKRMHEQVYAMDHAFRGSMPVEHLRTATQKTDELQRQDILTAADKILREALSSSLATPKDGGPGFATDPRKDSDR